MKSHLLLPACFFVIAISLNAQVHVADSMALVAIYDSTNGPDWAKQENWLQGPVATWEGITVTGDRVTGISFQLANLHGAIPESLFTLDSLKSLSIRENNASLHCDDRMQQWSRIHTISISGNMITGDINALCGMPHLTQITFFNMDLGGVIPSCLQNNPIVRLHFSNVNLASTDLPEFLGNIPTLDILTLENNSFTGSIPDSYCADNIRFLNLKNNMLNGAIPECLNADDQMIQLFLADNTFEGEIPVTMLGQRLNILDLGGNDFTGKMDDWPVLNSCIRLELDDNQFEGTFNAQVLRSNNFRILNISRNAFDGISQFDTFPVINTVRVNDNALDFSDLEAVIPGNANFTYAPQAMTDSMETITLNAGGSIALSMSAGGQNTTYQWFREGIVIDGATSASYEITEAVMDDAGVYYCEAVNDSFPDLMLTRAPVEVQLGTSAIIDVHTNDWRLAGNPVQDNLVLTRIRAGENLSAYTLSVISLRGEVLAQSRALDANRHTMEVAGLPQGTYFLHMESEEGVGVWKWVKI